MEDGTKRDCRGRIKAMGVVDVVLGGLCGLTLLFGVGGTLLGRAFVARAGAGPEASLPASLSSLGVYAIAAAFFFVAGVGALRLRRWVRPLVLAFMWPTLLCGVAGFALAVAYLPAMFDAMPLPEGPSPALQRAVMHGVAVVLDVVLFLALVAVPAVHVLVFQPAAVRETLERCDTARRFTDGCPTPVFGIAVSLVSIGLMELFSIATGVALFFGVVLTGPAAALLLAAEAAACLVLARLTFRCHPAGFWGSVAFMVYVSARNGVAFLLIDCADVVAATGMVDARSAEAMERVYSDLRLGPIIAAFWGVAGLSAAAYVLCQRKYFKPAAAPRAPR